MCEYCEKIKRAYWKEAMLDDDIFNARESQMVRNRATYSYYPWTTEEIVEVRDLAQYTYCPKCGKKIE